MDLVQKSFPVIQQHEILEQVVNARELHEFLGSKRQFANWIKERIESYEFVENVDYVVFNNFVKNPKGGRSSIEYAITVTMAKELAMVENNAKGKEVRKYFIECERQAKQAILAPQITSIEDLLNASLEQGKTATEICNQVTKEENIFMKACFEKMGIASEDAQKWLEEFNSVSLSKK